MAQVTEPDQPLGAVRTEGRHSKQSSQAVVGAGGMTGIDRLARNRADDVAIVMKIRAAGASGRSAIPSSRRATKNVSQPALANVVAAGTIPVP